MALRSVPRLLTIAAVFVASAAFAEAGDEVSPTPVAPLATPTPVATDDPASEKRSLFDTAMADYAANRCESAIAPLKTLVASGYRASDAANVLRACYDKLYGMDGSVAKLREEIAANPNDAIAHSNLGVFLMFQRQWEPAQKEVLEAIRLDPRDIDAKLNLAYWYAQVGQTRAAIREHEAILGLEPGNKRALIELCTLTAERENDPAKALPYCEKHAEGQETNEIAGVTLGLVRMRVGDLEGAEKAFQAVVDANPSARTATLSLGHLRQYRGDLDGAQQAFESVLAAEPKNEEARLALARLFQAKKDYSSAIASYREAYQQSHSGMALGGLAKAYLQKYFLFVIGALLATMAYLLYRYLNVRLPQPPAPAGAV